MLYSCQRYEMCMHTSFMWLRFVRRDSSAGASFIVDSSKPSFCAWEDATRTDPRLRSLAISIAYNNSTKRIRMARLNGAQISSSCIQFSFGRSVDSSCMKLRQRKRAKRVSSERPGYQRRTTYARLSHFMPPINSLPCTMPTPLSVNASPIFPFPCEVEVVHLIH